MSPLKLFLSGTAALIFGVWAGLSLSQVVPQPGPPTPIACAYNTTPPTLTNGQAGWIQCDNAGKIIVGSGGGGGPATIADGADVAQGSTTDAACATDNGTCTVEAVLKRIAQRITTLIAGGAVTLPTTPLVASGSGVITVPTAETAAGVTPIISAALESNHVIKASAGNFYTGYITTGATAGWLLLANATSAPTAGGAAIAPLACVVAPANQTTSITSNPPLIFSTGITMVFSTSGCLTNTASTTAFFSGVAK